MSARLQTVTLHVVRHGETAWNAERRFQMPDVPLSETGRAQAAEVAEKLAGVLDGKRSLALLASDYARAWETGEIMASRLGLPVIAEPLLRERNFGVWRGQLYSDVGEKVIQAYRQPRLRIEGGESWADVYARVEELLGRLRSSPPAEELVLVTHGGTMNVLLRYLEGCAIDDFVLQPLENCALRTLVLSG